uniref:glutathione transferase n=1 Tax=Gasterosteus aculeatus TaxID=69293 RepID=G3NXU7_GASAC
MTMKLAYWDIRGLAQPARLLLEYTGSKYEDKFYVYGDAPDYSRKSWLDVKDKLGMHFPNDNMKAGYLENLPKLLKQFSDYLGDRKWFAGDKITYVDFIMYELLDQHKMFHPTCLDDFKNLQDLLTRFEALEKIAAYMKSNRFMKTPVNGRVAKWGNK